MCLGSFLANILFEERDMRDLQVEAKNFDNGVELKLAGELSFCDSKDFMMEVPSKVRDKGSKVVFNFEKLTFIDSAGLGAVLYVSEALRMQCQTMQITNANEHLKGLLSKIKNVGTFEL